MIGRDVNAGADIAFDSPVTPHMVSRKHAIISCERRKDDSNMMEGGDTAASTVCVCSWRIINQKSLNGLFVNNIKRSNIELHDGDTIVFGHAHGMADGARRKVVECDLEFKFELVTSEEEEEESEKKSDIDAAAVEEKSTLSHVGEKRKLSAVVSPAALEDEAKSLHERRQVERREEKEHQIERKMEDDAQVQEEKRQSAAGAMSSAQAAAASSAVSVSAGSPAAAASRPSGSPPAETTIDALLMEHECPMCLSLLLNYLELPCGHRFCQPCVVNDWFGRGEMTCPFCSVEIDFEYRYKPPEPGTFRASGSTVEMLAANLPDKEREERKKKQEALDAAYAKDIKREENLRMHLQRAKAAGKTFLSIRNRWRDSERRTFSEGISPYTYRGRIDYCDFVGLTIPFLQQLNHLPTLFTVLANLSLDVDIPAETMHTLQTVPAVLQTRPVSTSEGYIEQQVRAFNDAKRRIYFFMCFRRTRRPPPTAA